jgi:ribosome maturation factor RimP
LLLISKMITSETIRGLIENDLYEKGFFLVDIQVKPSGKIVVLADNFKGITLDDCVSITRLIENKIDRNLEDYELEVSSPGLDNPLKLPVQYKKNAGRFVRVVTLEGKTWEGRIKEADDEKVIIETIAKKKKEKKKEENPAHFIEIPYKAVKTAKLVIR